MFHPKNDFGKSWGTWVWSRQRSGQAQAVEQLIATAPRCPRVPEAAVDWAPQGTRAVTVPTKSGMRAQAAAGVSPLAPPDCPFGCCSLGLAAPAGCSKLIDALRASVCSQPWADLAPFTSLPDGAALAASTVPAPRALGSLGLGLCFSTIAELDSFSGSF